MASSISDRHSRSGEVARCWRCACGTKAEHGWYNPVGLSEDGAGDGKGAADRSRSSSFGMLKGGWKRV